MKKSLFAVVVAAGLSAAFAADQTITGVISDGMCRTNHAMMQTGPKKMSDHDCTIACVKSGQRYVLTSSGKVYEITNETFPGLEKYAGSTVNATGRLSTDGKSITLTKLSIAAK